MSFVASLQDVNVSNGNDIAAAIHERRRRLARLKEEETKISEEIGALLKAARIIGELPEDMQTSTKPKRHGKPYGAISTQWRRILNALSSSQHGHTYDDIQTAASCYGVYVKLTGIRDLVRRFAARGLLARAADGRFVVTEAAVARFKLDGFITGRAVAPSLVSSAGSRLSSGSSM